MRFYPAILLILFSSSAFPDPESEALEILDRWTTAFSESDLEGILDLYASDALFLGTGSQSVVTEPSGIRLYFERALFNDRPRGAELISYSARTVNENVVVFSGLDRITGVRDGKQTVSLGRVTIVIARYGKEWKIVQFHRSQIPG